MRSASEEDARRHWTVDRLVGVFVRWGTEATKRVLHGTKTWGIPAIRSYWTNKGKG